MDPHSLVTTEAIKPKQKISPTSSIYIDEKNKDTSPLKSTNLHGQFVDKKIPCSESAPLFIIL